MTTAPACSVVIVNWNTRELLGRCLASIPAAAGEAVVEVIVVDNGSADGSAEAVRRRWPQVLVVEMRGNPGFAAGVNEGWRRASGRTLLVLNPDIELHAGCIPALLEVLGGNPSAGVVMPALLGPDGRRQEGYVRKLPGLAQLALFSTLVAPLSRRIPGLAARLLETPVPDRGAPVAVEQIPGACMFLRREVLESAGEMDEGYRLFFEDVDWCRRVRLAGWSLLLVPGITATHGGGGSFVRVRQDLLAARFALSCLRYFRKNTSVPVHAAAVMILAGNALVQIPLRSLQAAAGVDREGALRSLRGSAALLTRLLRGGELPLSALSAPAAGREHA